MNWIFADIQNMHNKHGYTSNTTTNQQIHSYTINQYNEIYNHTDKSYAIINIVRCHLHASHEITFICKQRTITNTYKYQYTSHTIPILIITIIIHKYITVLQMTAQHSQPTRLSAYSGLTSSRLTSDSLHSTQPTQFISEPRQFRHATKTITLTTQHTGQ